MQATSVTLYPIHTHVSHLPPAYKWYVYSQRNGHGFANVKEGDRLTDATPVMVMAGGHCPGMPSKTDTCTLRKNRWLRVAPWAPTRTCASPPWEVRGSSPAACHQPDTSVAGSIGKTGAWYVSPAVCRVDAPTSSRRARGAVLEHEGEHLVDGADATALERRHGLAKDLHTDATTMANSPQRNPFKQACQWASWVRHAWPL
jgi:hypothetical protein